MAAQFARAPHQGRPAGPVVHNAPNAALLIDFDNVTMGIRSDLTKELKNLLNSDIIKGKVAVQRAYADWRRYPQYIVPLSEASVDLIFAPAYGSSKKNATDIRLAIDALELVFTRPEIGTFILLSGDSDFSSLVLKLKEYGKYVIGVGIRESASDLLVQNCDEYYSYSILTGLTRTGEEDVSETTDPWALVEIAVNRMADNRDVMRSDRLKQVMLQIDPNFNEKELGFSKFSRFVMEAANRGLLQLRKLENGQYEILPAAREAAAATPESETREPRAREARPPRSDGRRQAEPRAGRSREAAESRPEAVQPAAAAATPVEAIEPATEAEPATAAPGARVRDLASGYELLRRVVRELINGADSVRDSDVKRRMLEYDPDWDESQLGFSKFSRFLRQAHDAEIVTLRKVDNGSYEVSLPGTVGASGGESVGGRRDRPRHGRDRDRDRDRRRAPAARGGEVGGGRGPTGAAETVTVEAPQAEAKESVEVAESLAGAGAPVAEAAPAAAEPKPEPDRAAATAATPAQPAAPSPARLARVSLRLRTGTRGRSRLLAPPPVLPGQTLTPPSRLTAVAAPAAEAPQAGASVEAPAPTEAAAGAPAAVDAPVQVPPSAGVPAEAPVSADAGARTGEPKRRSGRKSPAKAAARPTPETPAAVDPAALGLPTGRDEIVGYLSSTYKGVGAKTAETLVDAVGADRVFHVLETDPDRVREVLKDARRSEALLNGWRTDLARRTKAKAAETVSPAAELPAGKATARRSRGRTENRAAEAEVSAESAPAEPVADVAAEAAEPTAAVDERAEKTAGRSRSRGRRGRGTRKKAAQEAATAPASQVTVAESTQESAAAEVTASSLGEGSGAAPSEASKGRAAGRRSGRGRRGRGGRGVKKAESSPSTGD